MTDPRDTDAEGRPCALLLDDPRGLAEAGDTDATVLLSNIVDDTVHELVQAFRDAGDDVSPHQPVDDAVQTELARYGYQLVAYDHLHADVDAGGASVTARLQVTLTADPDTDREDVDDDTPRRSEPADFGGGESTGVQTL